MLEVKNDNIFLGLFWKIMEQGGTQGIQFVVQIVLARLLLPQDYGLIALITIFITLANVVVQNGFNTALIQKRNADELDFSSAFYTSFIIAGFLYIVLFFTSPFIATFYKDQQLVIVIRVLSITLFFGAINSIQNAIISKNMQFKRLFFSSLGAIIVSGTIGIIMAYLGFGIWALVVQQLTNNFMITFILWFTVKWRPLLKFSVERAIKLFSFGWKILCASLIDTLYKNLYSLIIGKIYNPEMLGYYNRGNQFPSFIVSNINGSIQSVMFPALSASQNDKKRMKAMVRRSIVTSSFIVFPTMVGLAACAEPLVKIILTDKWLPCVPFMQLMCISYAFWPIHTANLQAINALGRSDIFLNLEIIKKCIGLIVLFITIPFGIYVMVAFQAIISFISTIINSFPNRKLLNYSFKEQYLDIMPSMLLSVIMGIGVYTIQLSAWNVWRILAAQISAGAAIYIGLAYVFKLECLTYLLDTIKAIFQKQVRKENMKE